MKIKTAFTPPATATNLVGETWAWAQTSKPIAIATVSYQAIKAGVANPVRSLRTE